MAVITFLLFLLFQSPDIHTYRPFPLGSVVAGKTQYNDYRVFIITDNDDGSERFRKEVVKAFEDIGWSRTTKGFDRKRCYKTFEITPGKWWGESLLYDYGGWTLFQ